MRQKEILKTVEETKKEILTSVIDYAFNRELNNFQNNILENRSELIQNLREKYSLIYVSYKNRS